MRRSTLIFQSRQDVFAAARLHIAVARTYVFYCMKLPHSSTAVLPKKTSCGVNIAQQGASETSQEASGPPSSRSLAPENVSSTGSDGRLQSRQGSDPAASMPLPRPCGVALMERAHPSVQGSPVLVGSGRNHPTSLMELNTNQPALQSSFPLLTPIALVRLAVRLAFLLSEHYPETLRVPSHLEMSARGLRAESVDFGQPPVARWLRISCRVRRLPQAMRGGPLLLRQTTSIRSKMRLAELPSLHGLDQPHARTCSSRLFISYQFTYASSTDPFDPI